jgi:hypothetical protein
VGKGLTTYVKPAANASSPIKKEQTVSHVANNTIYDRKEPMQRKGLAGWKWTKKTPQLLVQRNDTMRISSTAQLQGQRYENTDFNSKDMIIHAGGLLSKPQSFSSGL